MHKTTTADDQFRRDIVDLILTESRRDANAQFLEQKEFAAWSRQNKKILIGLFGGSGIQNLARTVAWMRRERVGRREPPELLCQFADLYNSDRCAIEEPILAEIWREFNDLLRAVMLDRLIADVMLRPAAAGLTSVARTALIVLTSK